MLNPVDCGAMGIQESLIAEINVFITKHGLSESGFGKTVMGDYGFVFDLKSGKRSPQVKTVEKVRAFMSGYGKTRKNSGGRSS